MPLASSSSTGTLAGVPAENDVLVPAVAGAVAGCLLLSLFIFLAAYVCRGRSRARKPGMASAVESARSSGTEMRASAVEPFTSSEYEKVDGLLPGSTYETPPIVSSREYDVAPPEALYAPMTLRNEFTVHAYGNGEASEPSGHYDNINDPLGDSYDSPGSKLQ